MKQAFVTGATRGIGRAIALALAKDGFEVGFCYQKIEEAAKALTAELNAVTRGYAFRTDLSQNGAAAALGKKVLARLPELSVLVNNAGVSSYGLFQNVTPEEYDRVFSVNLKSAWFLTRELVAPMLREHRGRIVNVSSVWGQTGASCEVLYSASKAALIGFTKALAKELAPSGITVNCVAPGVVDTDMMARFSAEEREEIASEIPAGRFAAPEEIASAVAYLVRDGASFITGQVLAVNGGQYC